MDKRLIIIDGNSIINRAFYALPDMTNSEGLHTNAIYGFTRMLFKIIDDYKPTHISVAFDRKHQHLGIRICRVQSWKKENAR